MSDAIANIGGSDLFATYREPAWHAKGIVAQTEYLNIGDAMRDLVPTLAGRTVSLEPVSFPKDASDPLTEWVQVPDTFASVSTWPTGDTSVYGTVGARYGVVQDVDALSVFDGFRVETVGALYDGRKTFATFAVDRETVIDPNGVADTVKVYGLGVNSHDGTSPVLWATTPVRVVCQNTLNAAMGNLSNVVKVRHTRTAAERMSEHAALYRATMGYMDVFDAMAADMFAASLTEKKVENIFTTLFPKPEEDVKGSLTKWENKRGNFYGAYQSKKNEGIHGTAWGVWNGLTESNQWARQIRKGERGTDSFVSAGMGLDGPTNTFRSSTLALVRERAGLPKVPALV